MNRERKPVSGRRVALYARVSTDKQSHEGTIASQVTSLCQQIEADGEIVDPQLSFIDDGVSGRTLVRPALERLRDQAAAGAIDRLYVLTPDRLARRHAHQMVLVEELQACGVEVVWVNRPVGTTPEDQLLLQVQGVIAEYEREKILERTRRGRLHAARCGRVSVLVQAAFGYRYIDKHSGAGSAALEVVEEEARVVQSIFAWVGQEGCSLHEVVRRLAKLGVRSRRGLARWNPSTLYGMLRNPVYQGQAAYGKTRKGERRPRLRSSRGQPEVAKRAYSIYTQPVSERITIAVPAIVDTDLFAAVQEQLAENQKRLRQRRQGPRYLLQGLTVCDCCGYALIGRGGRGAHGSYRCSGRNGFRYGGRGVCQNPSHKIEILEAAVWNDVCALLSEPDRLRQEFERRQQHPSEQVTAASGRLRGTSAKIKQGISRLIDAYTSGLVEVGEFEPRIRTLKERLAKVEEELRQLTEHARRDEELRLVYSHIEQFADHMKAGLSTADWEQRREVLRALIKRVEVGKEIIRIVYKVPVNPFAKGPERGPLQHCLWRHSSQGSPRAWFDCGRQFE
jgi:site-specific DNA recombinase